MNGPGPPCRPGYYHPLALGFTCVFELEAGKFSNPIVGWLVPQTIDGEPYEAVSYVWGDAFHYGKPARGTEVLSISLSASSDNSDPSVGLAQRQVRRLWADAHALSQWTGRPSLYFSRASLLSTVGTASSSHLAILIYFELYVVI